MASVSAQSSGDLEEHYEDEEIEEEEGVIWSMSYKHQEGEACSERDSPTLMCDGPFQDGKEKIRVVKAASVGKLVEHLAPYRTEIDVSYRTCFLATYRTFITTTRLIQLLKERLVEMTTHPTDTATDASDKAAVQRAIISFIRLWLDTHRMDFYSPPTHPDLCTLESLSGLTVAVTEARKEIGRKTLSLDGSDLLNNISTSAWLGLGGGQPFSLFSLSVQDFVHSLTAEDKYIFQSVMPHQCLSYARSSRSAHAPTVKSAIHHFNKVSLVTMATVLQCEGGPEERGRVIGRWVDIAQYCRLVKNFSSLLAVLSGLQSAPVFRLKKTWDNVPRDKTIVLEELTQLFTAEDNFFLSRDLLCKEGTSKYALITHKKKLHSERAMGVIPYLGTFLTDLTMTHNAFPDIIHTQCGCNDLKLVNFDKRRREFQILAQLTLYQKSASLYMFPHNPNLIQWLSITSSSLSQQQSHELSQTIEPEQLTPPTTPDLSPRHTLRQTIRQLFKTAFGDSLQFARHYSHIIVSSVYHDDDLQMSVSNDCLSDQRPSCLRHGESSIAPSTTRRKVDEGAAITSRTVRVAMEKSSLCLYRTISVTETDRARAVVKKAMKKYGIEEDPAHYHLQMLNHLNEYKRLSDDANIFYALADSSVLLLCHNQQ